MYLVSKKIGETPLQTLENFRKKKYFLKEEKLSYIGRLDPMAEGKLIIISGEENKNRKKFLNFDKEYSAKFLIGASTDSLDILGFVNTPYEGQSFVDNKERSSIEKAIKKLSNLKTQKYPWFSGKTINGVKMFDIFKSGHIEGVKRPINKIRIKKIFGFKTGFILKNKLKEGILKKIKLVKGDFRQKEITKKWKEFFRNTRQNKFQTFSFNIKVSSGTFIRSFAENFKKELGAPILLYNLKRTKIYIK